MGYAALGMGLSIGSRPLGGTYEYRTVDLWLRRLGLSLAVVTVSISLMPLVASADVGDVVNTAADTTGDVVNTAADTTGDVVNTAADTTGDVVNTAADTTGDVVNTAADTTGDVVNTAADTTGDVVNTAADTTGDVVVTAADTTGDVVVTAADTTGNVASTAGDTVGAGSGSVNGGTPGDHSNGASRSGPSTTAHDRSSDQIGHTSTASGSHPRWQVRRDAYEREHLSVVGYRAGRGPVVRNQRRIRASSINGWSASVCSSASGSSRTRVLRCSATSSRAPVSGLSH